MRKSQNKNCTRALYCRENVICMKALSYSTNPKYACEKSFSGCNKSLKRFADRSHEESNLYALRINLSQSAISHLTLQRHQEAGGSNFIVLAENLRHGIRKYID